MIRKLSCILLVISCATQMGSVLGGDQKSQTADLLSKAIFAPSDLLAGFLVAFQAQQKWWADKGVNLTPRELMTRHYAVHCSRNSKGQLVTSFFPPSPYTAGGEVTYYVDQESLEVAEVRFER